MSSIILPAKNKAAALYAPLKLFVPAAVTFFLVGIGYYVYTFMSFHRLGLVRVALWSAAVIVFLIGLISGQIASLKYRRDT